MLLFSLANCLAVIAMSSFPSGVAGMRRIDTHIHALPPAYQSALAAAGGDPSGYPTPNWDPAALLQSMDNLSTDLGVVSVSSPGAPILGTGSAARNLTRELNTYLLNLTSASSGPGQRRLAFFAVLPDFRDVDGVLAELDFLFSSRTSGSRCAGVTMYTSYGSQFPGDLAFASIWERLNSYHALVFLHPSVLDVVPKFIAGGLPQPIVDYPLATTRAAVDLVMRGVMRDYPEVDIILSHAGGALPFVGPRAIGGLFIPDVAEDVVVGPVEAADGFARFYYDIALSTSMEQLDGLLDWVGEHGVSRVLFGSDFPYAPQVAIDALAAEYLAYVASNERGHEISPDALYSNAVDLLEQHGFDVATGMRRSLL